MGDTVLEHKLRELTESILRFEQFELVDLSFSRGSGGGLLRIVMDRDGGVSVEDCAMVSRELSAVLDVEDLIPGRYILEVSSPGLDRPLKGLADFMKFGGRLAKVTLHEAVDGQKVLTGRIMRVEGENVLLDLPGKGTLTLRYSNVKKARLEVEF